MIFPSSFVCGNFNSFHPSWGSSYSSSRGIHIYDTVNFLWPCILNNGSCTRVERPDSNDSAIDLSFSSPDLVWNTTWSNLDDPNGSDHILILITIYSSRNLHSLNLNQPVESSFSYSPSFNLNKADWPSFPQYVQYCISTLQDTTSSTISYFNFINIINLALSTSIPVKKSTPILLLLPFLNGILLEPRPLKIGHLFLSYIAVQALWLILLHIVNLVLLQSTDLKKIKNAQLGKTFAPI